ILFACQPQDQELLTEVDVEPKPLNMIDVQKNIGYPKAARDNDIQGLVIAKVLVSKEGEYISNTIINSPDPVLTKAVQVQIEELRFEPAKKDGKAVQFYVNIPFNFKLID
ncbi:MAG: energy transducer TonB, partial [Bacteroidota bacterium]